MSFLEFFCIAMSLLFLYFFAVIIDSQFRTIINILYKKNILSDDDIYKISSFSFMYKRYLKEKYKNKD